MDRLIAYRSVVSFADTPDRSVEDPGRLVGARRPPMPRSSSAAGPMGPDFDYPELYRTADPRVGDPRAIDPRTGEPRTGEPRTGEHRVGDPRVGEHRGGDPRGIPPRAADPHQPDPRAADPRMGALRPDGRGDVPPVAVPPVAAEPTVLTNIYRARRPAVAVFLIIPAVAVGFLLVRALAIAAFGGGSFSLAGVLGSSLGLAALPLLVTGLYGLVTGAAHGAEQWGFRVWAKPPLAYLLIGVVFAFAAAVAAG